MATYIQGLTDYIPQIQPFQPDLNFYGNVMQAKQTKYDAAKKQISKLYGSLLYSPMTHDDNIKRRDEFFKVIDNDIKRISGMDLSLQQNVDQALNVFQGFYDDKYMINDMMWTKNYNNAVQKHQALKNCTDPKKCGGIAWDEGLMDLQYKREDFRKMSLDETLNASAPTYTPYYDWKKDALKFAHDNGYKVTKDVLDGDYIVTRPDGTKIQGLWGLFKEGFGDDPRVQANYETMASVKRNSTARANASLYGSVEEAERQYAAKILETGLKDITKKLDKTKFEYNSLNERINQLQTKAQTSALTPEEQQILDNALSNRDIKQSEKESYENSINAIKANADAGDMPTIRRRVDGAIAQGLLENDLSELAYSLSAVGEEKIVANPIREIKLRHQSQLALASANHNYNIIELEKQHDLKLKEIEYKALVEQVQGSTDGGGGAGYSQGFGEAPSYKEAGAGTNIELPNKEDAYLYTKSEVEKSVNNARAGSLSFLYTAFDRAKQAALSPNGSVTATKWLKDVVGNDWKNISDQETFNQIMVNNEATKSKSVGVLYQQTLNMFKNNKTGGIGWGEDLLTSNALLLNNIKVAQQAANGELAKQVQNNLQIATSLKATAGSNPLYKYVDELFYKGAYDSEKKRTDPNKSSGVFRIYDKKPTQSFANAFLSDPINAGADYDDVEDAWEKLRNDYLDLYNSQERSIATGVGLTGGGGIGASTLVKGSIDPAKRSDAQFNADVMNTLNNAFNQGAYKIGIGGNNKDTYESVDSDQEVVLSGLVRQFMTEVSKGWKPTDAKRPVYGAEVTPVGGGQLDQAAITLNLPANVIQDNSGKGKLLGETLGSKIAANRITVFFDKSKVQSPIVERAAYTPFQKAVVNNSYVNVDAFSDYAGDITASFKNGMVTFTTTFKDVDERTGKIYVKGKESVTHGINSADDYYNAMITRLNARNINNQIKIQKLAEAQARLKQ